MRKSVKLLLLGIALILTVACVSTKKAATIDPFANIDYLSEPKLDFKAFFDGNLEGFGIIYSPNGKMQATEQFTIKGKWREKNGVLEKTYTSNDSRTNLTWLVEIKENGTFGVVGHGFIGSFDGKQIGNAASISYSTNSKDKDGNKIENRATENYVLVDESSMIGFIENFKNGQLFSKETISLRKIPVQKAKE